MAFSVVDGGCLLYGGYDASPQGDTGTWLLDGLGWRQIGSSGPTGIANAAMASSDDGNWIVLLGGRQNPSENMELWRWSAGAWVPELIANEGPYRYEAPLAWSSGYSGFLVVAGSRGGTPYLGDMGLITNGFVASSFPYGQGCGGLELDAASSGRPLTGTSAVVRARALAGSIAFLALGLSNELFGPFPIPLDMTGVGMEGCSIWSSADIQSALPMAAVSGSTQEVAIAIPNDAFLLGLKVYIQSWALAPGVNSAGIATSGGLQWALGAQ